MVGGQRFESARGLCLSAIAPHASGSARTGLDVARWLARCGDQQPSLARGSWLSRAPSHVQEACEEGGDAQLIFAGPGVDAAGVQKHLGLPISWGYTECS